MRPSASKANSASFRVMRVVLKSSHSALSDGSLDPATSKPVSI
jgi:hypothetical protein